MTEPTKRDVSISMAETNKLAMAFALPTAVIQLGLFWGVWGIASLKPQWNILLLATVVLIGVPLHELLHAVGWTGFGHKSFRSIEFGVVWKEMMPFTHLTEPIEVNAYRAGTFLPGLVVGILPYIASLITGSSDLFWIGLAHTVAASGDWLILWVMRSLPAGTLVEDHPSRAGCLVIEENCEKTSEVC
jgi:hypothetical protein